MNATDELRRLLDERGVEWTSPSGLNSRFADSMTFIGNVAVVSEIEGSDMLRINFDGTPEQAIEATLGRKTTTRHGRYRTKYGRSVPCCERCGYGIGDMRWHYCPSCGAEVIE